MARRIPKHSISEAPLLSDIGSADLEASFDVGVEKVQDVPQSSTMKDGHFVNDLLCLLETFCSRLPRNVGFSITTRRSCLILALFPLALLAIWIFNNGVSLASTGTTYHLTNAFTPAKARFEKPEDIKVIALIFYGRREKASILDCYLKRNLVDNGGWLDEVVWGVNTDVEDDLGYLNEQLLPSSNAYRKVELEELTFNSLWNKSVEAGNIYVKIDDDVTFFSSETIPAVVHTLLTDTESVAVSANMINSPELSWLHYRTGAVRAYLPELAVVPQESFSSKEHPVWRASELPQWSGPQGFLGLPVGEYEKLLKQRLGPISKEEDLEKMEVPAHRWLSLPSYSNISETPIAQVEYGEYGSAWWSWAIAAQQHYSLLENLEEKREHLYYLYHGTTRDGSLQSIWDGTGDRLSINFLAIRGETILDNLGKMEKSESDEVYLSRELPKQVNKRM